ncbi:MAG: dihydropteroate synthase [Dehalococcoidia bacterium]|jgi:5-methyltetrahydrofolate--homocysteine methyltransferase|nr:dihydropteroate synthase [Dehalococcoidia bacterium]|tara:strand:- start:370 stop:1368 length:999 start_codon:yes stop_codon:yes gene_type:complete
MSEFKIIGENIHTTRSIKLGGVRTKEINSKIVISYRKKGDEFSIMDIPKHFEDTQPYKQGQLKHFMIAIWHGMNGNKSQGIDYIKWEIERQTSNSASYLDINVDEYSYKIEDQIEAMRWLVDIVKEYAKIPVSIDSSNPEIIKAGLDQYDNHMRPMVNSLSLERKDLVEAIVEFDAQVVVSAASESSMPEDSNERIENLKNLIDYSTSKGLLLKDLFIDPLIFPISVSSSYGTDALEAISKIKNEWPEVNITGGMSNVSFGLPKRRLVNDVFISLAIDAGANSGIINPVESKIDRILSIDKNSEAFSITKDMLEGRDEFCVNYLSAFREKRI